jgi:hypothetical protein
MTSSRWTEPLASSADATASGAKAARLALALRHGLPVLDGWVVPAAAARPALRAGAAAIAARGIPAGRRAVLNRPLPDPLIRALNDVSRRLGAPLIVRSSSPLESDPRWSGAFSSVAEVGAGDIATAVRSVWASAFAPDPIERLGACGLAPESVDMAVLIQPELRPACGGTARTSAGGVRIEGVTGHPGPMLSGWADGASATVTADGTATGPLATLINPGIIAEVAQVMMNVFSVLGDDTIEWASADGQVWLLQSRRAPSPAAGAAPAGRGTGRALRAVPAAPGTGTGRMLYCRPHQPLPLDAGDVVLLIDRPLPALAPLLFAGRAGTTVAVRAVVSRSGPANSHLAEVARAIGVPMVVGCALDRATDGTIISVDGTQGLVIG